MSRYNRQTKLFPNGEQDQTRLRETRLLVIGAGGLSATLLPLLVGAGCGNIAVMDYDRVEMHNLHRQTIFRESDIGGNKAELIARHLMHLNSDCHIEAMPVPLTPEHAETLIPDYDVVIDAADAVAVTYALSDICKRLNKPMISASAAERAGYVGGFCHNAPSYRAIFPSLPERLTTCGETGVIGPVVATIGALQAKMVLDVILGASPSPLGLMFRIDAETWKATSFRFDEAIEPKRPFATFIGLKSLTASDRIFLMRNAEINLRFFDKAAQTIDEASVLQISPNLERRSVFICRRGVTAWRAAETYMQVTGDENVAIIAFTGEDATA